MLLLSLFSRCCTLRHEKQLPLDGGLGELRPNRLWEAHQTHQQVLRLVFWTMVQQLLLWTFFLFFARIAFFFLSSFSFWTMNPAGWELPVGSPPQRSPVKSVRRKDKGHRKMRTTPRVSMCTENATCSEKGTEKGLVYDDHHAKSHHLLASKFAKILQIFSEFSKFFRNFQKVCKFLQNFLHIFYRIL